MKYILDSDILIYLLNGNQALIKKIGTFSDNSLYTTIINHSELYFGAYNSTKKEKNLEKLRDLFNRVSILPYCETASLLFAELKVNLKKEGKIIADLDLMIASICIKNQMPLITNNTNHFDRIKKLTVDNWVRESYKDEITA